jgi:hypothetical protein
VKFQVLMKDPDVLDDAIKEAIEADPSLKSIADEDEREAAAEVRRGKVHKLCSRWFEYGEYLNVEIDTDAQTCVVVPVGK